MNLYAFELGRIKDLCFSELAKVLEKDELVDKNFDTAIFRLDLEDPQTLQDQLGGTIKIIEIFKVLEKDSTERDLEDAIQEHLETNFENQSGKIPFSISILSYKKHTQPNIKSLLNFSKKILKSQNLNSRFVNKGPFSPKPSTIFKARVIEKGVDINIIEGQKHIYIGKSVAIQNIDSYSARDYDKPKRDAKVGMLPPKLAQIMINLAGKSKSIYDPFCGTGTILIEAMLMGKDAVGSDIEEKLVDYTDENCKWAQKKFNLQNAFRAFTKDATKLDKNDLPEKIDAIVTEGYLGPALSHEPDESLQEKYFETLGLLHLEWLKRAEAITTQRCKIVMCLTAYKTKKGIVHLPNFEKLAKRAGYEIKKIYNYKRSDQVVTRDIVILEKL